jgi:hypothetical protein
MGRSVIVARRDFPVIELAPLAARPDLTIEELIAGLSNNHRDITSAHFAAVAPAQETPGLYLAKPLENRQHLRVDDLLQRLEAAGFVPADLRQLALLAEDADELWAAGVCYIAALGANSIWRQPDGNYAAYLILNPADRGFHLQWLGHDTEGGTKVIDEAYRGELNGQLWLLVRCK